MPAPIFFKDSASFRKWLQKNHEKKKECIVGYFKVGTGKKSLTWSESVDEALCFGWIDGVRRSIDEERYQIRFTPRNPTGIWSAINIRKVTELSKLGRMHKSGLEAFARRTEKRSKIYSHEKTISDLSPSLKKKFRSHKRAWNYFQSLAPSYRKTSIHWIMSAKQESTRLKRLDVIIAASAEGTNPWKDNKYTKR